MSDNPDVARAFLWITRNGAFNGYEDGEEEIRENARSLALEFATIRAERGRAGGMSVAAAASDIGIPKKATPCEEHGLTPKRHCREMERMLREIPSDFLMGEGDSPHEAVRRLREAYDEARDERNAAEADLRNARANVRDLQAQLTNLATTSARP